MKSFIVVCCCLLSTTIYAQKKFVVDQGEIGFTSNAKLELIHAASKKIQGILDPTSGKYAFIVTMQSFEGFNSGLQREHFNDKYMETDKYYDATFSGKIDETINFAKDGVYPVNAIGSLTTHGVKKQRTIPGVLKIENGKVTIDANFSILLADHNIKIPEIIGEKIATEILIKFHVTMSQR